MGGLVLGGLFIRCVFFDEGMNEFVEGCFLLMCLRRNICHQDLEAVLFSFDINDLYGLMTFSTNRVKV